MTEKYTDSDKYQQEIAAQYKDRVFKFTPEQVIDALAKLSIQIVPEELRAASAGNVNATYLTPDLAIKVNQDREHPDYIANKIAADKLSADYPVPKVVAYDFFQNTPFETLVSERVKGTMLLEDIFELSPEQQAALFRQILAIVRELHNIKFNDFGWVNLEDKSYPTYAEYLKADFAENAAKIRKEGLCSEEDLARIEQYFYQQVGIFNQGESVFVHTDLHMGNMLHEGDKLTGLIDFDWSLKAPKVATLQSLLGFIDNPSQFVEGTKDFAKYKGKNFYHLLPVLREELSDVFEDPQLVRKLNIIHISSGIMWVADNWSEDWNKEMIHNLLAQEVAETDEELERSYYGKVLAH
ncbi:MAG: phosphotransferase [Patescibacteria group bacterium]|jgi:tRNA A-37 threonylcarbamoyl transferase component Bud32